MAANAKVKQVEVWVRGGLFTSQITVRLGLYADAESRNDANMQSFSRAF